MEGFYGGSVGINLKGVQFFPYTDTPGPCTALEINSEFTGAFPHILLEEVSFAGPTTDAPPNLNLIAINATGRMKIQCRGVFIEAHDAGVVLDTNAHLYGDLTCGGNPTTDELIQTASTWTGNIDINVSKAGASKLLVNYHSGASQVFRNAQPYDDRVVYPVRAGHVLASDYVKDAGAPSLRSGANGLANMSKPGTGLYQLNFDTNKFAPTTTDEYTVEVIIPANTGGRSWVINEATTTYVKIQFYGSDGSAADVNAFVIKILGRDGI
jgi:hypothetical protein